MNDPQFESKAEAGCVEVQRCRSQKLEAIGRLAGGIAHEFNNLLTVINGYCERMLQSSETADAARADLELIHKAGQRAASLTSQLLAFGRRQVLQPHPFELNTLVLEMDRMLRRLLGEHITMHMLLEPALGATLADPGQIGQAIVNLAVNARDAMPDGGSLTLETRNLEVQAGSVPVHGLAPGRYVSLAIRDTGHGMDDATLAHIFEPFFTTQDVGTGLGLPTVYGIVMQSGGQIAVESVPDQGTTVRVFLPRVDAVATGVVAPAVSAALPCGDETILLVEDEELVRDLVREFLEKSGYRVLEAPHAEAAMDLALRFGRSIDLLLTDVVLPGLDGAELARRLRPKLPNLRTLYVSGYAGEALVRQRVFETGAMFLSKPFTRQSLVEKVRAALDAPPGVAGVALVRDDDRELESGRDRSPAIATEESSRKAESMSAQPRRRRAASVRPSAH